MPEPFQKRKDAFCVLTFVQIDFLKDLLTVSLQMEPEDAKAKELLEYLKLIKEPF